MRIALLVFTMSSWPCTPQSSTHQHISEAPSSGKLTQKCANCTTVPFNVTRTGPPADVDMPWVRILAERSGVVIAVQHWFDGRRPQSRLIKNLGSSHWVTLATLQKGDEARKVIYAVGSGKTRALLMDDYKTGSIERSDDSVYPDLIIVDLRRHR